jgi:hypothetical protein
VLAIVPGEDEDGGPRIHHDGLAAPDPMDLTIVAVQPADAPFTSSADA